MTGISFSNTSPVSGQNVTGTINFQGVSGPFTFTITFSSGVTPPHQTVTAPSGATSASFTFTIDPFLLADDPNGKDISVTVTSSDANGSVATVSGTLHVSGIPSQMPPIDDWAGGDPPDSPLPEPEPPVDLDAQRLARIESELRYNWPEYIDIADLLWYHDYWETHTPDLTPPSNFPVAGQSLIHSVDFVAPNILKIAMNPELAGDHHLLWVEGVEVASNSYSEGEHSYERTLYFDLIGPARPSAALTLHARKRELAEDLVIRVPLPELDIAVEATNRLAQVRVTGDDEPSYNGNPQLGSGQLPLYGARIENTTVLALGVEELQLSFVPRGPQAPALLVYGHSAFWRYRSALVEFSGLPVKGWDYDYTAGILHVTAAHGSVQLGLNLPEGVKLTAPAGSADFTVPSAAATYPATLQARDGADEYSFPLRLGNAAGNIPLNTLRAWPLNERASLDQPVRILVASGLTAHPFQYMTGCRVTATPGSGMQYVRRSFNAGAPGGKVGDRDGGWDALDFEDFLLPPDGFIANHMPDSIDFNLTPLGAGQNVYFEGELFSFEATFTTPGPVQLGFERVNVVNRTYYQDGNQAPDYFWSDIRNAPVAGLPSPVIE